MPSLSPAGESTSAAIVSFVVTYRRDKFSSECLINISKGLVCKFTRHIRFLVAQFPSQAIKQVGGGVVLHLAVHTYIYIRMYSQPYRSGLTLRADKLSLSTRVIINNVKKRKPPPVKPLARARTCYAQRVAQVDKQPPGKLRVARRVLWPYRVLR